MKFLTCRAEPEEGHVTIDETVLAGRFQVRVHFLQHGVVDLYLRTALPADKVVVVLFGDLN